jgi:hypothetical protein
MPGLLGKVHVTGGMSEAWVTPGGPSSSLSIVCLRSRVGTHRPGMLCPRVEKIQDMDVTSKNVHGYLVQGDNSSWPVALLQNKIFMSFSNFLMALLYMSFF